MSSGKQTWYIITVASLVLMFVSLAFFVKTQSTVMLIIGVITVNAAYQTVTRTLISTVCDGMFQEGINSSSEWFKTSEAEERLYEIVRIKSLKPNLPKTERTDFSLRTHGIQDIIDVGCEIEIEHEISIAVSILGTLVAIPFGYEWIFGIVAAGAVLYDMVYIAVQRYNRPRLEKVQLRRRGRFFEKMEKEEKQAEEETAVQEMSPEDEEESE